MTLTFTYQDAVQSDTATLRIHEYDGSHWLHTGISSLTVTKSTSGQITASGWSTHTAIFATFFAGQDSSAPISSCYFQGSSFSFGGALFSSTDTFAVLQATDPVVNGFYTGVATITYRVDGSSGDPFTVYSSSIPLGIGVHFVDFRSYDWTGNLETIRTSTVVVTAGDVLRAGGDYWVLGDFLAGFLDSDAKAEIESRAEDNFTLKVSSVDGTALLAADNIGNVGLRASGSEARLYIQGNSAAGEIGLQLRSGNSTTSLTSTQLALGYNGTAEMRHAIRTQHNPSTAGNRMEFLVWSPAVGSTATLANLAVLAFESSTAAAGGLVHVRPAGTATAELTVSNGSTPGGGTIHRAWAGTHSSRELKTDIEHLSEEEAERAWQDVLALKPASFRYKRLREDGVWIENPQAPVVRGLIYEDSPESIRGPHRTLVVDERLANVELTLQTALRRLEDLQARLKRLQEQP